MSHTHGFHQKHHRPHTELHLTSHRMKYEDEVVLSIHLYRKFMYKGECVVDLRMKQHL